MKRPIEHPNTRHPRCECCRSASDVHLTPRPGQIPGAAHASRWLCGSCELLELNPAAARLSRPIKPKEPQSERLPFAVESPASKSPAAE